MIEEKKKPKKARGFAVQRNYYNDVHDLNDDGSVVPIANAPTVMEWRQEMTQLFKDYIRAECLQGAFIFHDKDIADDGSPKTLHIHAVLKFENPRSQKSIMKKLGLTREQNAQFVKSYVGSYRYLTHVTDGALNEKKHVYPFSDVWTYNVDYVDAVAKDTETKEKRVNKLKVDDFIAKLHLDILKKGKTALEARDELLSEFDDDTQVVLEYVKNARSSFERDMRQYDEVRAKKLQETGNRALSTGYIFGPGGVGKTVLARSMARLNSDGRGFHAVSQNTSDKTFDLASMYKGERASVFDEVEARAFQYREFLGIFDKDNYTPVNSRNVDKHWLPNHVYFTNSIHFLDWRRQLIQFSAGGSEYVDPIRSKYTTAAKASTIVWQVTRRFHFIAELHVQPNGRVCATVFVLNEANKGFSYAGDVTAPADYWLNAPEHNQQKNGRSYTATEWFAFQVDQLVRSASADVETRKVIADPVIEQDPKNIDPNFWEDFEEKPTREVSEDNPFILKK